MQYVKKAIYELPNFAAWTLTILVIGVVAHAFIDSIEYLTVFVH